MRMLVVFLLSVVIMIGLVVFGKVDLIGDDVVFFVVLD